MINDFNDIGTDNYIIVCFSVSMENFMTSFMHDHQIFKYIIISIFVNMMNIYFCAFQ